MAIQRFDPRARLTFYACLAAAVLIANDWRALSGFAALGIATFLFAQLPWSRVWRIWAGALIFIAAITAVNLLFRSPLEAAQQALRALAMVAVSLAIVLTFDPAVIGVTFRRMGVPDRLAFALDLTARFAPMLARDFRQTVDAQRARGYELEAHRGDLRTLFAVGRRLAPLFIPVVVRAVLDSEDRANAMDLRAFGTAPRTWLRSLHLKPADYGLIGFSILVLAAGVASRLLLG
ncbi:MAG: energy-coupling factor transporter transmembrane component T [Anaerolineae bacterium]|nr:energy-coupling factor transporter transmembrane protein EcfT [Thermoflexales bacterium]MDW8396340.1 energy-coupling factor transporter transmembrane component T [Anaerolineae bacterium]